MTWAASGKVVREIPAQSWELYLESESEFSPTVSSRPLPCPQCKALEEKQLKDRMAAGESDRLSVPEVSLESVDFQEITPLLLRPAFAWGLRTREIFAGTGRWTQAMRDAGIDTAPSVEYYGQPLNGKDPQPQHDIRDPAVRERLLLEFGSSPGPEEPNVIQFAPPCVSHSPWQIRNGGTRTFENPEGTGKLEVERGGTLFGDFVCQGARRAHAAGKEFIESSARDGRCPKF